MFDNLGVPTAVGTDKVVGPSTCVTVLGIEIDWATGELCLPTDKLRSLQHLLQSWSTRHTASRRELQSLVGHLSFAAKVVPAGRTFTRRLIDACTSAHGSSPIVHLSSDALADIRWWQEFLPVWNGKALMRDPEWSRSRFYQGRWFAGAWSGTLQAPPYTSIMWREMWPISLACQLWGLLWTQKKILLHCDNASVCAAWESGTCRHPGVTALIRSTLQTAARHNFCLLIHHIAGVDNGIADALSRAQFPRFRLLAPRADLSPSSLANIHAAVGGGRHPRSAVTEIGHSAPETT